MHFVLTTFFQCLITALRFRILKKHDKRTALTASVGFPQFVRRSLDAHMDSNGNINSWTFYNTSLPHVLLASLTDTLLPILPSLDDYMCLICTSIAFKPIRLNCSHLFCVRYVCFLVQYQERHLTITICWDAGVWPRCSELARLTVPCVERLQCYKQTDVSITKRFPTCMPSLTCPFSLFFSITRHRNDGVR